MVAFLRCYSTVTTKTFFGSQPTFLFAQSDRQGGQRDLNIKGANVQCPSRVPHLCLSLPPGKNIFSLDSFKQMPNFDLYLFEGCLHCSVFLMTILNWNCIMQNHKAKPWCQGNARCSSSPAQLCRFLNPRFKAHIKQEQNHLITQSSFC